MHAIGSERAGKVKSAVLTALLSKGMTMFLQFVSIPIVARTLGPEEYGVYTAIISFPLFFSFIDTGIGPLLVRKISEFSTSGKKEEESRYFSASLQILLVASLVILFSGGLVFYSIPTRDLWGEAFEPHANEMRLGSLLATLIISVQMLVNIAQRARGGYMEVHINNLFGAISNICVGIALLFCVLCKASVIAFALTAFGVPIIFQSFNFISLLRSRGYLCAMIFQFQKTTVGEILKDSFLYSVTVGCLAWQREVVKFILASHLGPLEVGRYGTFLAFLNYGHGLSIMATNSIWPAIVNAKNSSDSSWLSRAWKKMNYGSLLYGVIGGVLVFVLSEKIVSIIFGQRFRPEGLETVALSVYFCLITLSCFRFIWLLAYGYTKRLFVLAVCEFLASISLMWIFRGNMTAAISIFILSVTHAGFSVLGYVVSISGIKEIHHEKINP